MTDPTELKALRERCDTCKSAGMVWAKALAFPIGMRRFVGGRWNKHEDGVHVEVPCPACDRAILTTAADQPKERGEG